MILHDSRHPFSIDNILICLCTFKFATAIPNFYEILLLLVIVMYTYHWVTVVIIIVLGRF